MLFQTIYCGKHIVWRRVCFIDRTSSLNITAAVYKYNTENKCTMYNVSHTNVMYERMCGHNGSYFFYPTHDRYCDKMSSGVENEEA